MIARTLTKLNTNKIIALWFLGLEILDVITTRVGVSLGATETNPMFSVLHFPLNVFLVIKMLVVAVIFWRLWAKGITRWMVWVVFAILGLVVLMNTARIIVLIFYPELDSLLFL
jgi:hypothetical protein